MISLSGMLGHLASAHKINKQIEPSNKSKSEKLNHEKESSITLDPNSEVSSQTSSGQLKEYFGMGHEGNKPIKKECSQSIDEFQSPNSSDHLGQFAMVHEANNPIKSECLQLSDNPKIDDNKEQDCQMAADLAAAPQGAFDFIEVAPENWIRVGGQYAKKLRALTERVPLTLHGLSLNIGGFAPIGSLRLLLGIVCRVARL